MKIFTKVIENCRGCPNAEYDRSYFPPRVCIAVDFDYRPKKPIEDYPIIPEWCPLPSQPTESRSEVSALNVGDEVIVDNPTNMEDTLIDWRAVKEYTGHKGIIKTIENRTQCEVILDGNIIKWFHLAWLRRADSQKEA